MNYATVAKRGTDRLSKIVIRTFGPAPCSINRWTNSKALARGSNDHEFSVGCYLFTATNFGLVFSRGAVTDFPNFIFTFQSVLTLTMTLIMT